MNVMPLTTQWGARPTAWAHETCAVIRLVPAFSEVVLLRPTEKKKEKREKTIMERLLSPPEV